MLPQDRAAISPLWEAKTPSKSTRLGWNSARGATQVVIFSGITNATRHTDILDGALIPFIEGHYPTNHRFQQDNDPKHTSRSDGLRIIFKKRTSIGGKPRRQYYST